MEYILTEIGERSFVIGRKRIGSAGCYNSIATCRNRIQAEKLISLLNQGNSLELVREFHDAFKIPTPSNIEIPGLKSHPDISVWLNEEAEGLSDAGVRVKEACIKLKAQGADVTALLRLQLIVEELAEVAHAMSCGDAAQTLHELADLRYVVDGTALSCGLGGIYAAAIVEIHRANMSKLDEHGKPVLDKSGRVAKSKLFKKADVKKLLGAS